MIMGNVQEGVRPLAEALSSWEGVVVLGGREGSSLPKFESMWVSFSCYSPSQLERIESVLAGQPGHPKCGWALELRYPEGGYRIRWLPYGWASPALVGRLAAGLLAAPGAAT
jgi:hypothetical protein